MPLEPKIVLKAQIGLIVFLLVCMAIVSIWSVKRRNARKLDSRASTGIKRSRQAQGGNAQVVNMPVEPEQEAQPQRNRSQEVLRETGLASYYSDEFHGNPTASGELYNKDGLTAAHRTFPFGTLVRVTNLKNKRSVIVRINDRGLLKKERMIDLSARAAREIGLIEEGVVKVTVEILK